MKKLSILSALLIEKTLLLSATIVILPVSVSVKLMAFQFMVVIFFPCSDHARSEMTGYQIHTRLRNLFIKDWATPKWLQRIGILVG